MATIINTASGRGGDLALEWFLMCEDLHCDITQFKRSGKRSRTLDKKLTTAIVKIVDGELGRKVHKFISSNQTDEKRSPKGRELWCILLVYYSTDCRAQAMYSLEDLEQVKCQGNNLERFMNSWNMVLDSAPVKPDDETLRVKFFEQIKNHPKLQYDTLMYRRGITQQNDQGTYRYLLKVVQQQVVQDRCDYMREQLKKGIAGPAPSDAKKQPLRTLRNEKTHAAISWQESATRAKTVPISTKA